MKTSNPLAPSRTKSIVAAGTGGVGGAGGFKAAGKIAHANRVDLGVVPLDAADRVLRQLDGGNLLCRQRRRQFGCGLETPLRFGQGGLPISFATDRMMLGFRPLR